MLQLEKIILLIPALFPPGRSIIIAGKSKMNIPERRMNTPVDDALTSRCLMVQQGRFAVTGITEFNKFLTEIKQIKQEIKAIHYVTILLFTAIITAAAYLLLVA